MYTLNLRIKKAATPEKTMGYGVNPLEKTWLYSKLTLELVVGWWTNFTLISMALLRLVVSEHREMISGFVISYVVDSKKPWLTLCFIGSERGLLITSSTSCVCTAFETVPAGSGLDS